MTTLKKYLNDLAGTSGLDEQGAANAAAGTNGLALQGALNALAGTSGIAVQGVLNLLAGTSGLGEQAAAAALVSKNLLTANQASVETDTTGFAATTNCSISRVTTQAAHRSASLQVSSTAAGSVVAGTSTGTSGTPVSAGTQYTAVLSARSSAITANALCRISWWTSGGAAASTASNDGSNVALTTGSFTQRTVTATAPANAAFASVQIVWTAAAGSELVRIDKLGLWSGSSTLWAP